MARRSTTKSIDFEKSLKQLETLVNKLEKGDLTLEESLKHFEEGVKLTRDCQKALKSAEQKISVLNKEEDGWIEKDLNDGDVIEDD